MLLTDLKQGSRSSEYNTDTNIYVLQEVHEKYEISLFLQRTRIPSDNQLQSDICAFFIYYMLFQIDYPGTVQPQVNTIAALVCKISCKSIFRSYQPAEISQKHAYQNNSIRQHPLLIICHENSSLIVYFYNKYTIKLCFII